MNWFRQIKSCRLTVSWRISLGAKCVRSSELLVFRRSCFGGSLTQASQEFRVASFFEWVDWFKGALIVIDMSVFDGEEMDFGPGAHSQLIRAVIEDFVPRFAAGSKLLYAADRDTRDSFGNENLDAFGVAFHSEIRLPDMILYQEGENRAILIETVTVHGVLDNNRRAELVQCFTESTASIVFVSVFPDRSAMALHLVDLPWETEAWIADEPAHMIHFNGQQLLGPYGEHP